MPADFTPKTLECIDCKQPFEFSPGEQKFFAEKQLNDPKRCKPCRQENRAKKEAGGGR
jgi:hypothetical protein